MALIQCIGCRSLCPANRSGRCTGCRLRHQRAKDARPERRAQKAKYDSTHRLARAMIVAALRQGVEVRCWRCTKRITEVDDLHLGHRSGLPSSAECRSCNLANSNEHKH